MSNEFHQQLDRVAELLAQRAKRKLGHKTQLQVVGKERPPDRDEQAVDPLALQPVDASPRARTMRDILRIARAHQWEDAIVHFLETRGVSYMSDLSEPQLGDLLDRMNGYVDAAEMGCSLPNCLAAN